MASFTDAITQFNPYVSQLPVDAMMKVGMQKQAQYEEGYKKIQSQIDQVAGLDLAKDVDKNYLQTKLNELGNNLRSVAAGDFSNFQLVNSVGGMTKQVAKDKTVQNAVSSTAWYRKQVSEMESKRKEGKSDAANEDLFQTQASSWLNDRTVGASFTSEYVPYTNVFKKLGEIAKSVGEDSTIVQQLFKTDGEGNPILENGKLQYNDVMAETLLKGKDKNKILNAFQAGMDSNDYRQLGITGRYQLKNKSTEELQGMLEEGFTEYQKISLLKKDFIQDKIIELKTKGGDQKIIDNLQTQVGLIDESISKRRLSTDQMKESDPDAIRGSIYSNNYLDSVSSALSAKETYTKYSKNPAVEMMMDREKLKLDQNKFKLEQDKFRYQQNRDVDQDKLTIWKAKFEKGLVDENGNPTGAGLYSDRARDLGVDDKVGYYFADQFEQGLRDDMGAQFGLYEKVAIADWMAKNSGKINPTTGKAFTRDEMKGQIAAWGKKVGMSYNDYIVLQGQKATDNYNNTKGQSLGAEYAEDFQNINVLGSRIGVNKQKLDGEKSHIKANAVGFTPVDLSKVNINPITVTAVLGGEAEGMGKIRRQDVTLSKQDVIDFAKFIHHDWEGGFMPGVFDSENIKKDANDAKARLIKKYGTSGFESIQTSIRGNEKLNPADMNPFHMILGYNPSSPYKQNPEIKKALTILKDDNYTKTMALREQYYKKISEVGVPKGVILYKDKPETQRHLATGLASIASDYVGIDDSYKNIVAAASDEKSQFQINIEPAASRYGKNSYSIQVTDAKGDVTIKPIKEKDYNFLTGKEAPSLFINEINSSIEASNYGSTNLAHMYTDPDAYSTAFVKDNETRTKSYNVAIDYVKGSNGNYFPKIYLQTDRDSWKLLSYNGGKTAEDAIGITAQHAKIFPLQVDDLFIKSLLQSK